MRILILGCAGYLGTKITEHLLKAFPDVNITGIDNFYHGNNKTIIPFLFDSRYTFIKQDLLDYKKYDNLNLESFDIVLPLAALVGFPICEDHQHYSYQINYDAIQILLGRLNPTTLVIYPNSNSGYGTVPPGEICTEERQLNPISFYGKTKMWAEEFIRLHYDNYIILRLATVFGPSYRPRNDLLVNSFVLKALRDKYNVIYDGKAMRNYIHIEDIARAFIHCIVNSHTMKGQIYNVGNDALNMSKLNLAYEIHSYVPHTIVEGDVGSDMDKRNYVVSSKKFYESGNIGFKCKYSLSDGIKGMIKYYNAVDVPIDSNY